MLRSNMPNPRRAMSVLAVIAASAACLTGCGEETARPSAVETVVVTQTATATPTPTPTPSEDAAAATDTSNNEVGEANGGAARATFVMPNEVGKALQAAQDDLQARSGDPFFYSDSKDATSADRFQVLDAGWQVCSQNKKPGAKISVDDQSIVFAVVRLEENCP